MKPLMECKWFFLSLSMEKVEREQEEKILRRREDHNAVYQTINKRLAVRRGPLKKQKKLKVKFRTSKEEYNFLQYLPLIYLWATESKGISRRDLDMLFYLQPLIVFQSKQILQAQSAHRFNDPRMIGRLKKDRWIKVYSKDPTKDRFTQIYYTLTQKATKLVLKVHSMILLEEPLPMHYNNNSLVARYPHLQDKKVMDSLMEFNRRVREKAENKT